VRIWKVIGMKVLVVDDAPFILKAIRDILEAYGNEVFEAVNGEEALSVFQEARPDVVLMDILMPKLDGVGATRKIMEIDSQAKVIVVTAVGKHGLEKDCMAAGARDFIVKPFKTKDLLKAINSLGENNR